MPAGKQTESSAMLYGLITFVVLFLVATTLAIMFYLKLEDAKNTAIQETKARREVIKDSELRNVGKIVGEEVRGKSSIGLMNEYFDELYTLVTGQIPEEGKSAQSKLAEIKIITDDYIAEMYGLSPEGEVEDDIYEEEEAEELVAKSEFDEDELDDQSAEEETTKTKTAEGKARDIYLLEMLKDYKVERDKAVALVQQFSDDIKQMQERWSLEVEGFKTAEDKLNTEMQVYIQQADEAQLSVSQMQEETKQACERRVETFSKKLEAKETDLEQTQQELDETLAMYEKSENTRLALEAQLESIKPRPDIEVEAFKPDTSVVSVDLQTGIVYLGIGSNDQVYRGLTFSIYDRSAPIPQDGKGKAEIKIFDVQPSVSAAKIVVMDPKNPIIAEDIAVNLIWKKDEPNTFVVLGEFDFDGDGSIDSNGREKVIQLIERWGSIVVDEVNINTDFVVVGAAPSKFPMPNDKVVEVDPLAYEQYEESLNLYEEYQNKLTTAQSLSIPVFNTARFKNLIGYDTEASMSKPN